MDSHCSGLNMKLKKNSLSVQGVNSAVWFRIRVLFKGYIQCKNRGGLEESLLGKKMKITDEGGKKGAREKFVRNGI